jgi:hypothetical protein
MILYQLLGLCVYDREMLELRKVYWKITANVMA